MMPTVCTYCEEYNTIERWDDNDPVCVKCGKCCELRCLPFSLDNPSYEMEYHDKALKLMDQSIRVINRDISPYGYPSEIINSLMQPIHQRQYDITRVVIMMIEMIQWRKAIWYKGEWNVL